MGKRSAAAFKLKPTIAFAGHATVGAVLALAGAGSVFAQGASPAQPAASAPETPVTKAGADAQQVVVTGIRRGIEAAISVKKNSDQIVEAISAEDIGKLPDTTIAESLARLPGVTTQRDKNGNATNVSIRGLGPDFNGYLLNGREQTSTGDSRADDLSVYPAELIAGATVYKTGDAGLMTAGLAGTIDNKLIDPLAYPGRVVSVMAQKTQTGRGLPHVGHGNRYSLAYIDQFADRKIGLALGFVHAFGRTSQVGSGNWGDGGHQAFDASGNNLGEFVPADPTATPPVVAHYKDVNIPGFGGGLSVQNVHVRDDRDGLAGVLEFKPNSNFTSEIDYFHSKIITSTKNAFLKVGLGGLAVTNATVSNNTITAGTFSLGANPKGLISDSETITDNDTLQSFGWRNSLKLNDTWRVVGDYSHNSAKRIEHDIEFYGGITSADTLSFTTPNGFGNPQLSVGNPSAYTTPGAIVIRDQTGWSGQDGVAQDGYFKGPTTIDKIDATRLDFIHDLQGGPFSDLQFGANVTKRTKDRKAIEALIVPASGVMTDTIPYPVGAYVENSIGGTGINMLTFDPTDSLVPGAALKSKYNDDILSKTWNVREDVDTFYGKLDIDTELGKIPVRGNVGLQYVHTDQSSAGFQANIGSKVTLTNPVSSATTSGMRYNNWLPTLNLTGDLGNGNLLRFGAGIELARPTLTDMRNSFTVTSGQVTGCKDALGNDCTVLTGSSGNPFLKPFKAKALDLSYEKYFANREGYFSAALFYKKLDTYIVNSFDSLHDFSGIAPALGLSPSAQFGYLGPYTTTVNGHGGNLKGFELAAQVPFSMLTPWLTGFGVSGSFSDTTSSVQAPNTIGLNPTQPAAAGTIPLPGLSHLNKKAMVYYERAGFSAFIAENYRSEYVGSVANNTVGGYPTLVFIEPQRWVSAQVGYEVQSGWLKGLGVRLEGNNLNKPVYKEANFAGATTTTNKTGASVDLRVSYKL